jgi:hypothetical protein
MSMPFACNSPSVHRFRDSLAFSDQDSNQTPTSEICNYMPKDLTGRSADVKKCLVRGVEALAVEQKFAVKECTTDILFICLFENLYPDDKHLYRLWKKRAHANFPNLKMSDSTLSYVSILQMNFHIC